MMDSKVLNAYSKKHADIERLKALYARLLEIVPGDVSPMEMKAVPERKDELVQEIIALQQEFEAMEPEISAFLDSIPDQILATAGSLRYRSFYTWREVGEKMGYSPSTIRVMWSRYLKSLKDL